MANTIRKRIRFLEEENRGLKRRLKAMTKASENNYVGLHYWKKKATMFDRAADAFNTILSLSNEK